MNSTDINNVDPKVIIEMGFESEMQAFKQLEKELRYHLDPLGELALDRLLDLQEHILLIVAQENRIQGFQMGMRTKSNIMSKSTD